MSILLDRLTKRYGTRAVVDRVSVEIGDGELFVLLGASGSGKSTVLRLVAGLARPDAGAVVLKGRDVTELPPQKRGVGFVFQNYSVFRHMTAGENIEFGLKIRGARRRDRRRKRAELLDLVGLGGLGDRYPDQLSGGQQQRVALARALAYEPEVLLLDEPFGALDAKIRSQLRRSFRQIQRTLGVTTILVTHDQDEAFEMADRIGVVDRGRLTEVGPGEDLYRRPESLLVATFVGAGTVLVGRCHQGQAEFGPLVVEIPPEVPHEEGSRVRLLVRPEQIVLEPDRPADAPALGPGEIVEETFAGATRRVRVRVPRLHRVRQIAPPIPYGEEGFLLDVALPADATVPERPWARLKEWRILRRPAPRLLACAVSKGTEPPVAQARSLAAAMGGSLAILVVAEDASRVDSVRSAGKSRFGEAAELRVRPGAPAEQIVQEQAEEFYDLIFTSPPKKTSRMDPGFARFLASTTTPVLFARKEASSWARILICTAVGEPGKVDVRVGGWLAARLSAVAALLHVSRPGEEPPPFVRAHLEAGLATLRSLDVAAEARVRSARAPLEGILEEAADWKADLVVVGGHGPRYRPVIARDDITMQLLARAKQHVLMVPEGAG